MQRDHDTDQFVDLGIASSETRGVIGPDVEDTFGLPAAGLSDD